MPFSERLKYFRTKKKLSVAQCAQMIGVSVSTYRDWENGRSISGEPYYKIANVFGVSLSELFGAGTTELSTELLSIMFIVEEVSKSIKNLRNSL